MSRLTLPLAALTLFTACGSASLTEQATTVSPPTTPTTSANNFVYDDLSAYSFDGVTLTITGLALDSVPSTVTYQRNANLDVTGFTAYTMQEDPLDRMFIGLAGRSADGKVSAVAGADGGQFNRWIKGAGYQREGGYDKPSLPRADGSGIVSYTGNYAGLWNGGVSHADATSEMLPLPAGSDNSLAPSQAFRVSGKVYINADFVQNAANGSVYDRTIVDSGLALPDVILVKGAIDDNGAFSGAAEFNDQTVIGTYAGVFAGTDAQWAAGTLELDNVINSIDRENEVGVFVLESCATSSDPLCASLKR